VVPLGDVPYWWIHLGIGHALLSECTCGRREDRYTGVCGMSAGAGEITTVRPAPEAICAICRRLLAETCIQAIPGPAKGATFG
jgi:hypothetical protein